MIKKYKRSALHLVLFMATFATTTMAGAEWSYSKFVFMEGYSWNDFFSGMAFSIPFLLTLAVHEFGHYFTAIYHGVRTSLPYFIPLPPGFFSIGTLGAIIRIRSKVISNIIHFDIGLSGPLAGFIIAFGVLVYGFATLPSPEYVYGFHPEYETYGLNYEEVVYTDAYREEQAKQNRGGIDVVFGENLLFWLLSKTVSDPARVPNPHELMHYPFLMAGFIALFFTSLNLFPIGQLDGGHIVYGMFGRKGHRLIASSSFILLLLYSGTGIIDLHDVNSRDSLLWNIPLLIGFYFISLKGLELEIRETVMIALLIASVQLLLAWFLPSVKGYSGWLFFAFVVGRFLGVQHPVSEIEENLDERRMALGWLALLIFLLSFSPVPLEMK